jgi:trehalose synthase
VGIGRPNTSVRANVDRCRLLVGDGLMDEVARLARELSGVRICHVNSTAYGGGVAELLSRYLPLIQRFGISAEWRLIRGAPEFFTVTKSSRNAPLRICLNPRSDSIYLTVNEESAELLDANYDVIVVHDRSSDRPVPRRHRELRYRLERPLLL